VGKIWVAGLKANHKVNKNETFRDIDLPAAAKELHLRSWLDYRIRICGSK